MHGSHELLSSNDHHWTKSKAIFSVVTTIISTWIPVPLERYHVDHAIAGDLWAKQECESPACEFSSIETGSVLEVDTILY